MQRSKITHLVTRMVICAAIGAVATCLVAWGIAVMVPEPRGLRSRPSGIGDGWSYWVGHDFGTVSIVRVRAYFTMQEPLLEDYRAVRDRVVPAWSAVRISPTEQDDMGLTYTEEVRGWPMLALQADTMISRGSIGGQPLISGALGVRWPSFLNGRSITILPLRPIWGGFILNTLFFGTIAFALMYAPGIVRRNLRRRAGRCETCGYDLRGGGGGATGCPECGAARKGGEDAAR